MINTIILWAVIFIVVVFTLEMVESLIKTNRIRRLYYSLFVLFLLPVSITTFILGLSEITDRMWGIIAIFVTVGSFAVMLLVTVLRLHDINSSGWLSLLLFIPLVNIFLIIALIFANGTAGTNRFGENPKLKGTAPLNTQD